MQELLRKGVSQTPFKPPVRLNVNLVDSYMTIKTCAWVIDDVIGQRSD